MSVAYGIQITSTDDRYISIAEKALAGMAKAANPGAFLVDLLPFCEFDFQFYSSLLWLNLVSYWISEIPTVRLICAPLLMLILFVTGHGFLARPSSLKRENGVVMYLR